MFKWGGHGGGGNIGSGGINGGGLYLNFHLNTTNNAYFCNLFCLFYLAFVHDTHDGETKLKSSSGS